MNRLTSSILAATMALSVGISGMIPANAAPVAAPRIAADNGVIDVQMSRSAQEFGNQRYYRGDRRWRGDRGWRYGGVRPGTYYRDGWHNGYRGYRHRRHGYRYHNGFWFPAGAFIAGAVIGSAINNPPRRYYRSGGGSAHVEWCYDRYRSYRAYDNTFQPYNGPRQQCYSPYS
jgi:hypothetical protein